MPMVSTVILFSPEERSCIESYADTKGKSFSDVVREAILEKIEDEADLLAYDIALTYDDGASYSMSEADNMFNESRKRYITPNDEPSIEDHDL